MRVVLGRGKQAFLVLLQRKLPNSTEIEGRSWFIWSVEISTSYQLTPVHQSPFFRFSETVSIFQSYRSLWNGIWA